MTFHNRNEKKKLSKKCKKMIPGGKGNEIHYLSGRAGNPIKEIH